MISTTLRHVIRTTRRTKPSPSLEAAFCKQLTTQICGAGAGDSPNNVNTFSKQFLSRRYYVTSTPTVIDESAELDAFADCEHDAIADLFYYCAGKSPEHGGVDEEGSYLSLFGVRELLKIIGEMPSESTLERLFQEVDLTKNGKIHIWEFFKGADKVLGGAPARIILVVGGPGSGKGILCEQLARKCNIVHLSSGDLLRDEVARDTPLGKECADIMKRGELVSSAVITALIRRRMRKFPGRRVLLDGFPRSQENGRDFFKICGKPELALHLECDDTILMERIIKRSIEDDDAGPKRSDDNIDTAIQRVRTYHKYHKPTMDWLRDQNVPIVNLDCKGTPENVWNQLLAIGRLMRPAAQLSNIRSKSDDEL